jgi:adenosylcobinamide kinase / adenosylcobinamide-phosphate guanylyltransferase
VRVECTTTNPRRPATPAAVFGMVGQVQGNDRKRLILLLGGARSGKSSLAETMARRLAVDGRVLYVATARAGDDEMGARIAKHRESRPAAWRTLEEPLRLGERLAEDAGDARVVLIDCATLWVTNLLLAACGESEDVPPAAEAAVLAEVDSLLEAQRAVDATMLVVSNEVGLGLVPPYPLGRAYRDLLGRVNQRLAAAADEVYLLVAGLPIELKALSRQFANELRAAGDEA